MARLSATESIQSRNIIHDLIGGGVAVTFGGESLSTSSLELLFNNEDDALYAYNQLNTGHIFELTDFEKTTTSIIFVVAGSITREFQIDTVDTWIVSCDIQAVFP